MYQILSKEIPIMDTFRILLLLMQKSFHSYRLSQNPPNVCLSHTELDAILPKLAKDEGVS